MTYVQIAHTSTAFQRASAYTSGSIAPGLSPAACALQGVPSMDSSNGPDFSRRLHPSLQKVIRHCWQTLHGREW